MSHEIKTLFEPKSVVLVGASDLGGEDVLYSNFFCSTVQNVSNYKGGKIHVIDFSGKLERSDKSIDKVRMGQDLAVVILPSKMLFKNVQKLLSRQVKVMVLIGEKIEDKQLVELSNIIKKKKLIMLGPDLTGVVNTANGLIAVPERDQISRGNVAIVSQDSCIGYGILNQARLIGISKFVSVGDIFSIDNAEILSYLSQDKETKVICFYIDRVRDGRKLIQAIREVVKEKPVIVLNGSAEQSKIFEAAIRQAGALQSHDVNEMLNMASGLAKQPPLRGERVAVVTNLAGQAKLFERYLLEEGLSLARPSEDAIGKIKKKYRSVEATNFINLGATAKADVYKFVVEVLLSDENLDGIAMINSIKPTLFKIEDLQNIAEVAKKSREKPIVGVVKCAEDLELVRKVMSATELPIYDQLHEAARVLRVLRLRCKQLENFQKK